MRPHFPEALIEASRAARHVVVFTGAGMSAESGLPTFREAQTGLWARYDPHELATPEAFSRNPALVWQWYAWRRRLAEEATPNPGHEAVAQMGDLIEQLTVVTQNIDGLHQEAGSTNVIELHGNIHRVVCFTCRHQPEAWERETEEPPPCPVCGGLLRPDVVWFGEALPAAALQAAVNAAQNADLFITVGTSGIVYPAAAIPYEAAQRNSLMLEVNPTTTELSGLMDFRLTGGAANALPAYVEAVWGFE